MELKEQQPIDIIQTLDNQLSSSMVSSNESDSSFDLKRSGNLKSFPKKTLDDQNGDGEKRTGKQGLKYAKISNKQRQSLVDKVTTTGCTIKSAAKELNINFSTAKAIMQIFRREGRITKKMVRDIKQKITHNQDKKQEFEEEKEEARIVKVEAGIDNNETNIYQQAVEARQQSLIIQQLQSQNLYLQGKVNQLQQDKLQLNQKCEFLILQCHQLSQLGNCNFLSQAQQMFTQPLYQFPSFTQ